MNNEEKSTIINRNIVIMSEIQFSNLCGELIKSLRKRKKLTQKQLAALCDCSDKLISKIETGNSLPNLFLFYRILNVLDASAVDFNFLQTTKEKSLSDYQFDLYLTFLRENPSKKFCNAFKTIINEIKRGEEHE